MVCRTVVFVLLCTSFGAFAEAAVASQRSNSNMAVNPIRKVVTMLQNMQSKITAEGDKKELKLISRRFCIPQQPFS